MWPNWKQRQEELLDYVSLFRKEGYVITATWIEYFAEELSNTKQNPELESNLDKMKNSFRTEFRRQGITYRNLLRAVEPPIAFLLRRPGPEQLKFFELFNELARNSRNLSPIDKAFKPFPKGNVRFYGQCLMYLMNSEGMFDQAIRLLYGLLLDRQGKPVDIDVLNEIPVKTIMKEFVAIKAPDELFEGWVEGHVRNAIAHCRFYYDGSSRRMYFTDIDLRTGQKWSGDYSFDEFQKLYTKLDNVWHLISHFIFLERIAMLILTPDLLDAGRQGSPN